MIIDIASKAHFNWIDAVTRKTMFCSFLQLCQLTMTTSDGVDAQ